MFFYNELNVFCVPAAYPEKIHNILTADYSYDYGKK